MARPSKIKQKTGKKPAAGPNPFGMTYSRQKHSVLGTKRNVPGKPIQKKKESLAMREKTLAVEVANLHKANKIVDKRIGEKNTKLTADERSSQRFIAQRKVATSSKFNLASNADEYTLTHGGRALTTIEKFDRMEGSDSEDDNGALSAEVVARANFGGGDVPINGAEARTGNSRADVLREMIAKSKAEKGARQTEKDQLLDAVDRLDANFASISQKLKPKKPRETVKPKAAQNDAYDRTMNDLKFAAEPKATPVGAAQEGMLVPSQAELEQLQKGSKMATRSTEDPLTGGLNAARENSKINARRPGADVTSLPPPKSTSRKQVRFSEDPEDPADGDDAGAMTSLQIPPRFNDWQNVLLSQASDYEAIIETVKNMAKAHHPSLKEGNKAILAVLLSHLISYYVSTMERYERADATGRAELSEFALKLSDVIYELNKVIPEHGAELLLNFVSRQGKVSLDDENSRNTWIVVLRLLTQLYEIGATFQPLIELGITLIEDSFARAQTALKRRTIPYIQLAEILADIAAKTKRHFPQLLAVLTAAIYQACPISALEGVKSPHPIFGRDKQLFYMTQADDAETHLILRSVFKMVQRLSLLSAASHPESFKCAFSPIARMLPLLPVANYPQELKDIVEEIGAQLNHEMTACGQQMPLSRGEAAVPMLKMLEPVFEEDFNPEHSKWGSKHGHAQQTKKLQQQVRKERKGAIKELRKDSAFIAKRARVVQKRDDSVRKEKVKQLMSGLQGQQSEHVKEKNAEKMNKKKGGFRKK
ncbi:unnamed protein product, partial [Mesorhabditis spiculigera]